MVEVSTGDISLSWNVAASREGKPREVTIGLPPSLQDGAAKLRLRALAPLSAAGSWKLPRIIFEGVVYRSSTIRLSVPTPLHIERLDAHGCRQTGVAALKTPAGEQLDFESYSADAAVDVSLSQRPTEVQAVSATATRLGQGKMSSRVATDFRTGDGPVFSLEAEVLPNWTIDSVESQPTDGLDDWTLNRRDGPAKLSIRLARPLLVRPAVAIDRLGTETLCISRPESGHRRPRAVPLCRPLGEQTLGRSVRFGLQRIAFHLGGSFRRADVKDLTAAELDLFAEPPGDMLFRDDTGTAGLRLSLENRRPTYSATIRVEAVAGDAVLAENYTFACTPSKAAPIDRVVVHFAGHCEGPMNWSVAGMDESRFSARRWTAQQKSSAGLTADEEAWDVTFRSPRSVPIEIRASRKTKLVGPTPVCLASLPDAARQEATVIVRSLGPQIVQIKTHRLKPLPTEAAPAGQVQTARASYQYDPRTEATPQSEPALVLTAADNQSPRPGSGIARSVRNLPPMAPPITK